MLTLFSNFWLSFLAGLFAPLGAVCVLPLYPGFLAYLASQSKDEEIKISTLGWIVTLGVITSLFLIGLIFTAIFKVSLTSVTEIVSPIAFGILFIVSFLLIFNVNFSRIFPQINVANSNRKPKTKAFLFGFFFGAIVLPCNPASLIILFAVSTSTVTFAANLVNFLIFGFGMAAPLLALSYLSQVKNQSLIQFLTKHHRKINIIAGLIMLAISLYYLVYVFNLLNLF